MKVGKADFNLYDTNNIFIIIKTFTNGENQMSNKTSKTLSIVLGAAFATTLAASNVANASEAGANPFAMNNLEGGYQVAKEGKCGEGKCGGKETKKMEGKCGEGKCGGSKAKKEGKCGEGKCGGK